MYQWRQPVLVRLCSMVVPIVLAVACMIFAIQRIDAMYLNHMMNLATKNIISFILLIIFLLPTVIWLVLSLVRIFDRRADLLIDEQGISERLSIFLHNPICVSWENIEQIHVYPTHYPYRQRSWRALSQNNIMHIAIKTKDGYMPWKRESRYFALQKFAHSDCTVNDNQFIFAISTNMRQCGIDRTELVKALEQHTTVSIH